MLGGQPLKPHEGGPIVPKKLTWGVNPPQIGIKGKSVWRHNTSHRAWP
jgi:hypothetical protein